MPVHTHKRRFDRIAAFALIASVASTGVSEEVSCEADLDDTRAKIAFAKICTNPLALSCNSRSRVPVEFEVLWHLPDEGEGDANEPSFITRHEVSDRGVELLLLSADRIPFGLLGSQGAFFADRGGTIVCMPDAKCVFRIEALDSPGIQLANNIPASRCSLDLFTTCHRLLSIKQSCTYSEANRAFAFERDNGSSALVEVNRRHERGGFSFTSFSIAASNGAGFQVARLHPQVLQKRSLADLAAAIQNGEVGATRVFKGNQQNLAEFLPLARPDLLEDRLGDPSFMAARDALRDQLTISDSEQRTALRDLLDQIQRGLDTSPDNIEPAVSSLCDQLQDEVYFPSIRSGGMSNVRAASGWEPAVARYIAERTYGTEAVRRIQNTLSKVALSDSRSHGMRLRALDYLGVLGAEFDSLDKLQNNHNDALVAMASTVAVRARRANKEHIRLIIASLNDEDIDPWVRLVCLEAAFLGTNGAGLDQVAAELLDGGNFGSFHIGRAVLAAAENPIGRNVLLESVDNGSDACPAVVVLPLLRWSTSKDTPEWNRLIQIASRIAQDPTREKTDRRAAELIAWRAGV